LAKLKGPLFSLGATQQLGKTLVFFGWKGLDVVREYVVPSNPKTTAQTTQRGYLTAAVAALHTAQGEAVKTFGALDVAAYALWASIVQSATTWFNQVCRAWLDQRVAGLRSAIFRGAVLVPGDTTIYIDVSYTVDGLNNITAGLFHYGTSKTALNNSIAPDLIGGQTAEVTIPGLTNGTKYYIQFRPTAHADFVGARSGIYHSTPVA